MGQSHARWVAAGAILFISGGAACAASLAGCGGTSETTDNRFSAETFDEYTEPLTNAVIGTPSGETIRIGAAAADGGKGGGGGGSSGGSGGSSSSGSSSGGLGGSGSSSGSSSGGLGGSSSGVPIDGGLGDDGGPGPDGGTSGGFGFWHFDDCSSTSHFLLDSSGEGANATHELKSSCVPGISNLGVQFRSQKDIVQVPDEPQFTVGSRVAVAAWVNPTSVSGDQPIVIKRLGNQTSFSLGVHNGNVEMSVVLTDGTTIISRAPLPANTWSHVAGMYDGTFVFLFIDGQQFGQVYGGGTLRDVFAPIRIGATTQTQHFSGVIDEVFVSTEAITAAQLTALACIPHPSTFTVNPATSGPVPFDTTVHYDIAVTNHDVGSCPGSSYQFNFASFDPTLGTVVDAPGFFSNVAPGATVTFGAEVTGNDGADPGVHTIPFDVFHSSSTFEVLNGQLTYELQQPTGCFVNKKQELMITSTSVVDDPVRTVPASLQGGDGGVVSPSAGVWTFGQLMRDLAPTPGVAPAMVLQLFQTWLTDQSVGGFTVAARPGMQQVLLDQWPRTPTGELDLDRAPLVLQAIVNRLDARSPTAGSTGAAGEGRFVFGVNTPQAFQNFTVIVEYVLPAQTAQDVFAWANRWHALSSHPFPSEEYNAALEQITRSFAGRGIAPGRVNGSALAQLRTNEIATAGRWEFRSFALSASTGFFQEVPVDLTPDLGLNGTQTLADFVNQNAAAIIAEQHAVPGTFEGVPFGGGSVFNDLVEWNAPGANTEARFHFSLETCNGCHGPETGTTFLMITPRVPGAEAQLSPFLTGTTAFDQTTGQSRPLNELARRKTDLTNLVCTPPTDGSLPAPPTIGPQSDGGAPPPPPDGGAPPSTDAGSPPSLDAGGPPPADAGVAD